MRKLYVKFKPEVPGGRIKSKRLRHHGKQTNRCDKLHKWRTIEFPDDELDAAFGDYLEDPDVLAVEKSGVARIAPTTLPPPREPNDPLIVGQHSGAWYIETMRLKEAWGVTTGASNSLISIHDTGLNDWQTNEFKDIHGQSRVRRDLGWNATNAHDRNDTSDGHGHGTWCAYLAAALGDNNEGAAGVDWRTQIVPYRILGGNFDPEDIALTFIKAVDAGVRVSSNSWYVYEMDEEDPWDDSLWTPYYSQYLYDAFSYACDAGMVVIAAAGNDGSGKHNAGSDVYAYSYYPPAHPGVIAVSAIDAKDGDTNDLRYADFTSHVVVNEIGGPGHLVVSVERDSDTYFNWSGTSASCPLVAGVASLIFAVRPNITADEVRCRLNRSTFPIKHVDGTPITGWDYKGGWGHIDAFKALMMPTPPPLPPAPVWKVTETQEDTVVTSNLTWWPIPGAVAYCLWGNEGHVINPPTSGWQTPDPAWLPTAPPDPPLNVSRHAAVPVTYRLQALTASGWGEVGVLELSGPAQDIGTSEPDYTMQPWNVAFDPNEIDIPSSHLPATDTPPGLVLTWTGTATRLERRVV